MPIFIKAQQSSFDALTYYPKQLVIADTDYLSTQVWGEFLYREKIPTPANAERLPTILFTPATPWEPARHRLIEVSSRKERWEFFELCRTYLEAEGREYFIVDEHEYEDRTLQVERILTKRFKL